MKGDLVEEKLSYKDDSGKEFEGFVYYKKKAKGKNAGVMVLHAFRGCSPFEKSRAKRLAKLGYVAFAVDFFGKGTKANSLEEAVALARAVGQDREMLAGRLRAANDAFRSHTLVHKDKIGAMGYCLGGMAALDMARRNMDGVRAVVSFHGTLTPVPGLDNEPVNASIAVHHGDADANINTQLEVFYGEMREREADWSIATYGKAKHGFTEPGAASLGLSTVEYNKEADIRSWSSMKSFFKQTLL